MKITLIFLNTFTMAFMYKVVLPSYALTDGGLIGLAMITNYLTEINLSYIYFFMNLPILIWVFKIDKALFKKSIIGMLSFSFFTFIFEKINLEIAGINPYVVVILSAFILGFNFYSLGKIKASFGGISPIAIKLDEWGIMKMSKFYLISDVAVLILLLVLFGPSNFFLSLIFVVVQSYSIDGYNKLNELKDIYIASMMDSVIKETFYNLRLYNKKLIN